MTHDSSSLSRSAGDGPDDVYFVRELDSLGFAVELVKVSVVNTEDVARAIYLATNLKGILQTSMVLCDEAFLRMAYGEWGMAILPEVRGTWDLHDIACQASIKLDFFGRLETRVVSPTMNHPTSKDKESSEQQRSLTASSSKLSEESSCSPQKARKVAPSRKKDGRIMAYHNASIESDDGSGASSDFLEILLAKAKTKPSMLKSRDAGATLPIEIVKRLFMFLLKSEDDPEVSTSLAALGLDSLVGVEMQSWWRQIIGFGITVLEMPSMGALESLGKHAAQGLLKLNDEEAS
ncbi:hypothetical protein CI102_13873 [Trichoderma harzianum]|nr:hypothetical protein CI102_13873 [Trichoderma harzianum]